MDRLKILHPDQSYSYPSYFEMDQEMDQEPDQILAEFGYQILTKRLSLPHTSQSL